MFIDRECLLTTFTKTFTITYMEHAFPKKPGRPPKRQPLESSFNQITVHLPPELVSALDKELEPRGLRSRSELIREACHSYLKTAPDTQDVSLARRMLSFTREERQRVMAAAAETLSQYYRTDPEMQEWQALETEDFHTEDFHNAAD